MFMCVFILVEWLFFAHVITTSKKRGKTARNSNASVFLVAKSVTKRETKLHDLNVAQFITSNYMSQ